MSAHTLTNNRDLRRVIQGAIERGWEASKSCSGHIKLQHPQYGLVFTPSTPSNWRGIKNAEKQIMRKERGQ